MWSRSGSPTSFRGGTCDSEVSKQHIKVKEYGHQSWHHLTTQKKSLSSPKTNQRKLNMKVVVVVGEGRVNTGNSNPEDIALVFSNFLLID